MPSKFIWRANLIVKLYKVLMFERLDSYVLWWLRVLKSVYCMISFSRVLRETFEIQQMLESLSNIWHLTLHWFDFCFCFFVHFFFAHNFNTRATCQQLKGPPVTASSWLTPRNSVPFLTNTPEKLNAEWPFLCSYKN